MAGLFLKRTPNVAHLRVLLLEYWRRRLSARGLYTTASGGSFPFIFRKTYTIIHLFCSDFVFIEIFRAKISPSFRLSPCHTAKLVSVSPFSKFTKPSEPCILCEVFSSRNELCEIKFEFLMQSQFMKPAKNFHLQ